ncbi:flagellar hook-basal body protein [Gemmatirosa kalamazoonensis]|uniref:Flagellar hook-basal body protein n=1 Tax=Gemmatirosa kalamazoonensis TaxID=861299 RepID=W0RBR2_9BACT|nr:flagellar hook-basal body protein [Gemmatirosa kalamazoonensis]AHG87750.1 flagellar hook-basal body protein [Gemmatirosa kalamazoonensis]
MPNGLSSAASALRYWERRQEIASNNLANASTDGFKAERVFGKMFGDALTVAQTATDTRAGSFRQTGNPLDVAIKGDAFLVVDTPNGERFSRGGSLALDPARRLVDGSGHPVLGEQGPIVVPDGTVTIDGTGTVRVNGAAIDRLRLERAGAPATLAHEGGTLLVPDGARARVPDAERSVTQGFVEESNVNTVSSMVDMIAVQRAYASVQKAISTMDAVRGTAANELGKPV